MKLNLFPASMIKCNAHLNESKTCSNGETIWDIFKEQLDSENYAKRAEGLGFFFTFTITIFGLIILIAEELVQVFFNSVKYFKSIENVTEVLMVTCTLVEFILFFHDRNFASQFGIWAVFLGLLVFQNNYQNHCTSTTWP
jgi:hypothetical protein